MAYGLFRTNPEQTRHRGLTYFMFPLHAEGVTVRGVDRLDGDEGFAEIFLESVFVPDADVIGAANEGWKVAMATTSSERGLSLRSPGRFMATAFRLISLYHRYRDRSDPVLRDQVIQAWMDAEAYRWFTFQTVTRMMQGESIGPDSSMNKVFWSEMDVRTHETALALIGDLLELDEGTQSAVDDGQWMKGFQFALAGPIYAGTNEIQRNIIAERVLGLPRK
jgi:alkylation response protein AidB-like acyl-CoA dehydrogenase